MAARCATVCGATAYLGRARYKEQIDTRWNHASALAARMGIRGIATEHKVGVGSVARVHAEMAA